MKIIEIESCSNCIYHTFYPYKGTTCCTHAESLKQYSSWGKSLDNDNYEQFPTWCPLLDKKE
jgi:hypothetical protein